MTHDTDPTGVPDYLVYLFSVNVWHDLADT